MRLDILQCVKCCYGAIFALPTKFANNKKFFILRLRKTPLSPNIRSNSFRKQLLTRWERPVSTSLKAGFQRSFIVQQRDCTGFTRKKLLAKSGSFPHSIPSSFRVFFWIASVAFTLLLLRWASRRQVAKHDGNVAAILRVCAKQSIRVFGHRAVHFQQSALLAKEK